MDGISHENIESANMKGWEIFDYSGIGGLQFRDSISVPVIRHPTDVLVEVLVTSVNPIDQLMTGLWLISNRFRCMFELGDQFCSQMVLFVDLCLIGRYLHFQMVMDEPY